MIVEDVRSTRPPGWAVVRTCCEAPDSFFGPIRAAVDIPLLCLTIIKRRYGDNSLNDSTGVSGVTWEKAAMFVSGAETAVGKR